MHPEALTGRWPQAEKIWPSHSSELQGRFLPKHKKMLDKDHHTPNP